MDAWAMTVCVNGICHATRTPPVAERVGWARATYHGLGRSPARSPEVFLVVRGGAAGPRAVPLGDSPVEAGRPGGHRAWSAGHQCK